MSPPTPLAELARLFLRLGATSFGGPAAHIAMMQDEVVRKRGWMTATAFLDALSATNLIPGPNSTELAMHVGHQRAGARGLIVAGVSFIVPAALMVGVLAAAYTRYASVPDVGRIFHGIKPVVIVIVAVAVWSLGRTTMTTMRTAAVAGAGLLMLVSGVHELVVSPSAVRWPWPSRLARRERSACLPPLPWQEPRRRRQRRSASA